MSNITIYILWIRKLMLRKIKSLAQGNRAGSILWSRNMTMSVFDPEVQL